MTKIGRKAAAVAALRVMHKIKDNRPPLRIWTQYYNPMILGGNVHRPISCEVTSYGGPVAVGLKIKCHLVIRPDGELAVIEPNGGIVGDSLIGVIRDIQHADPKVIEQQLAESAKMVKEATPKSEADFWAAMRVKPL